MKTQSVKIPIEKLKKLRALKQKDGVMLYRHIGNAIDLYVKNYKYTS